MSPFTRENYIDAIKNALSYLKAQVELNNAINKYSINIEAETFYAGFLNVVYGFRLKNGNHTERNIPSIDLYEECRREDGQRVAVQVTSNKDAKKVKKTLGSFCTYDYHKDYTRLIILMITEKKKYRSAFSFPADIGIQFDQSRDILDVYDLIKAIEQIDDTEHLRNIYDYLAKELPSSIIRLEGTEDHGPKENKLYDWLLNIFKNDRKKHPSIRMMDPDPLLFPKGLPEILSDGRYATEETEDARAIRDMISNSWKREERRHILLVGEGGIGKTVAMLTLPEEDWFRKLGIPVIYVPLQRLDAFKGDLNRYIREKIGSDNYERCLELANLNTEGHPWLLLLLDGFNEIPDKYKKDAGKYIREWMERPGIQIITTSRLGFFLENSFSKYRIQPLPHDTVRSFLLSAGIKEEQLPGENDRVWEAINVPLMLTMYAQIKKDRKAANRSSPSPVLEWKEPDNAANIIWDYLQMELCRCIDRDDTSHSVMRYATAIFAVAPYICCQMSRRKKFYIKREVFHELIRKALTFHADHQELLGNQLLNIRDEFDPYHEEVLFREADAGEYAKILIDNIGLFQTQRNIRPGHRKGANIDYSCSLMHQNFRDALAAFFICSCLSRTYGAKEKRALLNQADYYVKDYMAEHLSIQELAAIWNRHKKEDPSDGQITFILMDIIGRQRNYDYREMDFSSIDLTATNLHRLLSRRLDICPLPGDRNKLRGTNISVKSLSPNGCAGWVKSIVFSPDGRQLASGSADRSVRVWDFESGESHVLEGHTGWVRSVAFSPDGRQVVSGADDRTVRVWDLESGESRVLEGHAGRVRSVAFSPDGSWLASGADDSTVRIWNLENGESHALEGHTGWVRSVAFSPDGSWLASGADDSTVRIWELENREECKLISHADRVHSVAFSPDGKQLASGTSGNTVRIWDLESESSQELKGHGGQVRSVAFSPDGRQLASGASDRTVRIWDLESGESRVLEGHTGWVNSVAFSPDESRLASCTDRMVWVWDLESGEGRVLEGYTGWVNRVAFSRDGRWLAGGGADSTVRIWNLESRESRVLEGHTGGVRSVAFSPDGSRLASGAEDRTVRVWDLESGESRILEGHTGWVRSVVFSPDGSRLASGADDSTVRIWNLESRDSRELKGHTGRVNSVAFSPDGSRLASGAEDGTVRIWDLAGGESRILEGHAGWVNSVAFSPDGSRLASGAEDSTVRIWDLKSGESRVLEGHVGWVNSVAFSSGGKRLASGADDRIVRIWDLEKYWEVGKYAIISHINLSGANFELAIIDEKDKEMLRAAGARV